MNKGDNKASGGMTTAKMAMTALMAAVICILGPLSIPIGEVPISFTNLAIYFAVTILGWKLGTISYILYLLIGLVGVPVFSGFTGGIGKLAGPTGGYLIGFIFMAVISGIFIEKFRGKWYMAVLGMVLGLAVTYLFGTAWLCYQANLGFMAGLMTGVIPFLLGDAVKIAVTVLIAPIIYTRLQRAGLL